MKKHPINIAVALSLMLSAAILTLWCRGLVTRDRVAIGLLHRYFAISTFPHHLYLDADRGWNGMQPSAHFGLAQYPSTAKYWELRLIPRGNGAWSLALPFWLPLMFALPLPIWWMLSLNKNHRRRKAGLCPSCGYDLRASHGRCPECGTITDHGDAAIA